MACNPPTISFPNGGEIILDRNATIRWHPSKPHHDMGMPAWYELFFTDNFSFDGQVEWFQIATVPAGSTSFEWKIPFAVKGDRCRIGIRCRDHRGFRSEMSLSADDFTIESGQLSAPAVLSPLDNSAHRFFVPFILDHSAIAGTQSQRAFYDISYRSNAQNIDWTLIRSNIPIGAEPFQFDIRDLPPSNDYAFRVRLLDDQGNSSLPVIIRDVTLSPLNFFIIDTEPPNGRIVIQGNQEFTNQRDVSISIRAFDETTGVQSIQLQQRENGEVAQIGDRQDIANIKTWRLAGEDGIKFIEAVLEDFGGNVPVADEDKRSFRTFVSESNRFIDALLIAPDGDEFIVYTAFGGDDPELFRNQSFLTDLPSNATSLALFDDSVYIGMTDDGQQGVLAQLSAGEVNTVHEFSSEDSGIVTMAEFQGNLYIGLKNGRLYRFTGSGISLVEEFDNGISNLFSGGALLHVSLDNNRDTFVFDGTIFVTTGLTNAIEQI